MASLAVLLSEDARSSQHTRLTKILDFFGVPWKAVEGSELRGLAEQNDRYALLGSSTAIADAVARLEAAGQLSWPQGIYVYLNEDREVSERAIRSICGNPQLSLKALRGRISLLVHPRLTEITGPLAGIEVSAEASSEDAACDGVSLEDPNCTTIISAGPSPVFAKVQRSGVPIYICTSSHIVDIEEPLKLNYYDVKSRFCSAVPVVMFIRATFSEVAWHSQESGACLIVDDPLLERRYGHCDFELLRQLMRQHGFTTNVAFIPWNWRRTSASASDFFVNEADRFSVSVHGCDHIKAEFGDPSLAVLSARARLAQTRMRRHETRTGIRHDAVMVFPQGVFSSICPGILKQNRFLAAVNTEVSPVDVHPAGSRIKDVWDLAIMRYGTFPIFTRRYAHHGIENFAFDLLLGKPCLIVSHHDFFKDKCGQVVRLVESLGSLRCQLRWRSLGEVLRRTCRRRMISADQMEVEMYGTELVVQNSSNHPMSATILKRESDPDLIDTILSDEEAISWRQEGDFLVFTETIAARSERRFCLIYKESSAGETERSLSFTISVAARRLSCEIRDRYF